LSGGFALRLPMSETADRDSSIGHQAFSSHRHGYRRLRLAAKPWPWPPVERNYSGCGETAALSARRHALAQSEGHLGSGHPDQASGSTLRRVLARWAERGLLAKVHALLAAMLRGHPDLILDT